MSIPDEPAVFDFTVSLALTSRAPCKAIASQLQAGDPVRLCREPGNLHDPRAIAVLTPEGALAGYLYALDAGLLYLLFDLAPPLADRSTVAAILSPGHSRRSPIVRARIRLDLQSAAPLFVLIAILAMKDESFPRRFDFVLNPWLAPLLELHRSFNNAPDAFELPPDIVKAWFEMTRSSEPVG